MSYIVTTNPDSMVVYQRVACIYTMAEIVESNERIKTLVGNDGYRFLFDLRAMRHLDVPDSFLEQLAARMKTELPVRYRAIVANERHIEEMERFASLAMTSFENVKAFDDIDKACDWLMVADADILIKIPERRSGGLPVRN